MLRYIIRRIALAVPILLAVFTLVFLVVRVIPGDPAVAALGDYASKEAVEALRERMGLNEPLVVQYVRFLGNLLRGDFGESLISGKPISEQIAHVLPYTLELTFAAVLIGVVLGIPLGMLTAMNRNNLIDYLGRIISLVGLSVPAFYFGILLIILFAIKLNVLPAVGGGDLTETPFASLKFLVLPALTLGLIMTTSVTRLTRSAMLNVLSEDYVRTARAKGLAERVVLLRHALRAALLPIVSITGFWAASLIGDSVLTEVIFSRPGLGKMLVGAILQRDYTALQSVMVIYAAFVVGINLLTDLTYGLLDPRLSH
ncbi:MAG: ABC transporter permease [Anaerolineae bacterium]|jgi:ABC-type dipeptide/oligopeptide/nickel transport system permease component